MLTRKQQRELKKNLTRCAIVGKITILLAIAYFSFIAGYIYGYNAH